MSVHNFLSNPANRQTKNRQTKATNKQPSSGSQPKFNGLLLVPSSIFLKNFIKSPFISFRVIFLRDRQTNKQITMIRIATEILWTVPCTAPDTSRKFHRNPFLTFWIILLADRQTNKQTNATENITSAKLCFGRGNKHHQYYYCYYLRQRSWGSIIFTPCLFVCLFVCEQFPDHNFSCGVMKLSGINCYIKIWKWFIFERSRSKVKVKVEQKVKFT